MGNMPPRWGEKGIGYAVSVLSLGLPLRSGAAKPQRLWAGHGGRGVPVG